MNSDEGSQSLPSRELSPAEIGALDEAFETLDIEVPDDGNHSTINPKLREIMDNRVAAEKQDAKQNGWTAQNNRAISEHRKGDGREDYNARRKADRASKRLEETGQLPRIHTNLKGLPPEQQREHRRAQVNDAEKRWRAKLTPAQLAEHNEKKRLKGIEYRERKRDERKAAVEAARPEHFGRFGNS